MSWEPDTSPYASDWSFGLGTVFANLSNVLLGSTTPIYTDLNRPVDVVLDELLQRGVNVTEDVLAPYTLPATPTPEGQKVVDVFNDPTIVFDNDWLRGQLGQLDDPYAGDPDPFSGDLPPDILGNILGETQPIDAQFPAVVGSGPSGPVELGPFFPSTPGDGSQEYQPELPLPASPDDPPLFFPTVPEDPVSIWTDILGAALPSVINTLTGGDDGFTTGGQFGYGNTLPTIYQGSDEPGMGYGRRRRHMDPCNHKALMRATRRLVLYRKQNQRVEKALRKAIPASMRRSHGKVARRR